MREYTLDCQFVIAKPLDEVFAFFSDVANLERITPPFLNFKILTPGVEMTLGARIDYQIRLHGLPIRWKTRISAWEPPFRFVDEQLSGPYRQWIHEHTFKAVPGGVLMRDLVRYAVPGGVLAPMIHGLFVRRDLERIFAYRQAHIEKIMGQSGS
ncbi:CDP-paratose 2-epimerase [bacterium]|nr:MAG: CDP-paratose 2-epimerase [bacterium]